MNYSLLYEEGRALEKSFSEELTSSTSFVLFIEKLRDLIKSEDPQAQKVGLIAHRLQAPWSLRKFLDLLVPLERLVQKQTTDADWLHDAVDKNLSSEFQNSGRMQDLSGALQRVPFVLIADHIRSAFNIGALFRCADAFALEKIVLTGYSPLPTSPIVHKTALGTEAYTPWEHIEHTLDAIQKYKALNYKIVSLETSAKAQNIFQIALPSPMALIVGNERFGLNTDIMRESDLILKIPMQGFKNSLNVSTSFAVVAYEWHRQKSS